MSRGLVLVAVGLGALVAALINGWGLLAVAACIVTAAGAFYLSEDR